MQQAARYGDLRDVVIGAFQVSGSIRELPAQLSAKETVPKLTANDDAQASTLAQAIPAIATRRRV